MSSRLSDVVSEPAELVDLGKERLRIDDNAVADRTGDVRVAEFRTAAGEE